MGGAWRVVAEGVLTAAVDDDRVRHLFTAAEAEKQLGIPAGTIRVWFNRKRIWHYGLDERGNPMFDRDDLVRLRDRTQTRDQHAQAKRASSRNRRRT